MGLKKTWEELQAMLDGQDGPYTSHPAKTGPGTMTVEETDSPEGVDDPKSPNYARSLDSYREPEMGPTEDLPAGWNDPIPPDEMKMLAKESARSRLAGLKKDTDPGTGPGPQYQMPETDKWAIGRVKEGNPSTVKAKSLIAKAQSRKNGGVSARLPDLPEAGPEYRPDLMAEAPQPAQQAPQAPVQTMNDADPMPVAQDTRLADAQRASRDANREAMYARGMGQAADIISGTRYNDRAGEDIRAAGKQGVDDVLAQEAQGQRRANEGRAVEDQGFQRSGVQMAQGADRRAQATFEDQQTASDTTQALNKPQTREAKAYEAIAMSSYKKATDAIPPAQRAQMSANDWKVFLGEHQQQKVAGTGGGPKPLTQNNLMAISKRLPQETVNIYNGTQRIKQLAEQGGGWNAIGGVGGAKSLIPGHGLNDEQKAFRQEIGNIVTTFLKAGGGKNITSGEEKILIGNIGADPNSWRITAEMLQRGIDIIERSQAGNVRQSMGLVPKETQRQLFEDVGLPPDWTGQDLGRPTGINTDPGKAGPVQPPNAPPRPGMKRIKAGNRTGWWDPSTPMPAGAEVVGG